MNYSPQVNGKLKQITNLICQTVREYNLHPYHINCGSCENFAGDIAKKLKGAKAFWGDELEDLFPKKIKHMAFCHCFIRYKDKYYDAEEPMGVSKPHQLPLYQRGLYSIN